MGVKSNVQVTVALESGRVAFVEIRTPGGASELELMEALYMAGRRLLVEEFGPDIPGPPWPSFVAVGSSRG